MAEHHSAEWPFLHCTLTISHSRAVPGGKSTAPNAIFQSLLETRSTFFCRGRLSVLLLMQITKRGLSIFHILTVCSSYFASLSLGFLL